MKIAFVVSSLPSRTGVGTTAFNQACIMASHGHEVWLVLPERLDEPAKEPIINVVRIPQRKNFWHGSKHQEMGLQATSLAGELVNHPLSLVKE